MERHRRHKLEGIGACDRGEGAVDGADPRHDRAVSEPDGELGAHGHPTAPALDQADYVQMTVTWRHAVDDGDFAVVALEHGLQDERAASVLAPDALWRAGRGQEPAPMPGFAE